MKYIVLDMEWNQPGYTDNALCRNGVCMKNEVIQIGAVKLDENKKVVDKFDMIVKPESLKSMNKVIKQLTGITDEMLAGGVGFEEAVERFRLWCGSDVVFLIWGYDDIRILKSNLDFHGLDKSWLPQSFNLQMIFCSQTNNEKRQYSLSYALDYLHIEINAELHDALNDAYYTALVCQKLDMKKGMEYLKNAPSQERTNGDKTSTMLVKRKFRNIRKKEDIWANGYIARPVCPYCAKKMKTEKPEMIGSVRYNIMAHCAEHGDFMVVLRLSKTPAETFSVCQQVYIYNEQTKEYFEKKKRARRRRRPAARRKPAQGASYEKETGNVQ